MPLLVVVDTNVLVSALLSKHPDAATTKVLYALFGKQIIPIFNLEILEEYEEVFRREKFNFSKEIIQKILSSIYDNGIYSERMRTDEVFIDKKDIVFYEVCLAKLDENAKLVTGNSRHFPKKSFVLTPNELIELLNEDQ